jgi:hypothetical protein
MIKRLAALVLVIIIYKLQVKRKSGNDPAKDFPELGGYSSR